MNWQDKEPHKSPFQRCYNDIVNSWSLTMCCASLDKIRCTKKAALDEGGFFRVVHTHGRKELKPGEA